VQLRRKRKHYWDKSIKTNNEKTLGTNKKCVTTNNKANIQEIKTDAVNNVLLHIAKAPCTDEMKACCTRIGEPGADELVPLPQMDPSIG
jgi:hypothetical protein